MHRFAPLLVLIAILAAPAVFAADNALPGNAGAAPSAGGGPPSAASNSESEFSRQLYERARHCVVGVKFTFKGELTKRDFVGAGVVVRPDGLIMTSLSLVPENLPDAQLTDFKIVVPSDDKDPVELDAVFQGRDLRTDLAFVKPKDNSTWPAIAFEEKPPAVGDVVWSVGILPKTAGYHPFLMRAIVAANLRGEFQQTLVSGSLAAVGSIVFNSAGTAIGYVHQQFGQSTDISDVTARGELAAIYEAPRFFLPTRTFQLSLDAPPDPTHPVEIPWTGITQLIGLKKDVTEFFGLDDQAAVQIGDVVPQSSADRAGLKHDQIIVKFNGQPLERGDLPEELPQILLRKIAQQKIGATITFTVLPERGKPLQDVQLTLDAEPARPNTAKRYYFEDLGMVVREITFADNYVRKLPANSPGVVVALVRQQSAAQTAKLVPNDLLTQLNGQPITGFDQFRDACLAARKDHPHDPIVVVAARVDGHSETIRIEPPQSDVTVPIPGNPQ